MNYLTISFQNKKRESFDVSSRIGNQANGFTFHVTEKMSTSGKPKKTAWETNEVALSTHHWQAASVVSNGISSVYGFAIFVS